MIDPPQISTTTEHRTAVIRLTVPRAEIRAVMGPAIQEVMAVVRAQRMSLAGPVFSYHHRIDPAVFDLEVGVPVTTAVRGEGRVVPSRLPALRVARTVYRGPYEGLGSAWGEFSAWIDAQPHATRGEMWECYLKGPESNPDPATFETELVKPLR